MKQRTIRELCGEVWPELDHGLFCDSIEDKKGIELLNHTVEILMGVLARYENYQIINDKDLPVEKIEI